MNGYHSRPARRQRRLNLLETSFLLAWVPTYAVNRTKRLIKTPKLYWVEWLTADVLAVPWWRVC
jgi:predicted AAA+ superfamily ATPase